MSDRNLLDTLVEAERRTVTQPSEAEARAGWQRLKRALPGAVVLPQIDVPPASIEAAAAGKLGGLGKLWSLGHGGWLGKTIVGAVVATTVGTVGVVATRADAPRDPPAVVRAPASAPTASAASVPAPIEPATLPALPPAVIAAPPVATPPTAIPTPPVAVDEPAARSRAPRSATRTSEPRSSATPKPMKPSALDSERALLDAASLALSKGAPADALARIGEHASRHPKGSMVEDREALRVVALCRLGRAAEADRARTKFLTRWPSSMHAARVRAACSDEHGAK